MPRILILVLSTVDERYSDFIAACKSTWVRRAEQCSIRCIFYQGAADSDSLEFSELRLRVDDSLQGTALKLFRCLKYIEDSGIEYDYIFRTNLSSYIFIDSFVNWLAKMEDADLYAGVVGEYNLSHRWANRSVLLRKFSQLVQPENILKFASGSGFWISRQNVRRVTSDKALDFTLIDDAMIGECLHRHGIRVTSVPRIDCNGDKTTFSSELLGSLERMKSCYHIRLKSGDRACDVSRFYQLNESSDFVEFCGRYGGIKRQNLFQKWPKVGVVTEAIKP